MTNFIQPIGLITFFYLWGISLFGQAPNLQLTLRYNPTLTRYEVYALPDATPTVFNWGPSQISIVVPASVPDASFALTFVAGGAWQDNSDVYAPAADPIHDFHGVGSLGAITTLVQGVEKLLFHFTLPGGGCTSGLRLFINEVDPNSSAPGMLGGDFSNTIFAIVPGVPEGYEAYTGNYNNGGTVCAPLPLELTSFKVAGNMESIDMEWQTTNELNFDHFELERSVDALHFTPVHQRAPQGKAVLNDYSYTDFSVKPGIVYYYRLKMVDDDGFFIYSNLQQARTDQQGYAITSVTPNPTTDLSSIIYYTPIGEPVIMYLKDMTGHLIEVQDLQSVKGENTYTIDLKRYSPGVYWVSFVSGTNQVSVKVVRIE